MKLLLAITATIVFGLGATACGPDLDREHAVATDTITVRDNSFGPAVVEVPAGTTVTWSWEGDTPHNVISDWFTSETQSAGTYAYEFDVAGTYDFKCDLHSGMKGRIVVTE